MRVLRDAVRCAMVYRARWNAQLPMRIVLIVLLMFSAAPTVAGWVTFSETETAVYYLDYETLRSDGGLRSIWTLLDRKTRDTDGPKSFRTLHQYDCIGKRWRILSYTAFAGMNANVLASDHSPRDWSDVSSATMADIIFKLVCTP